MILQRQYEVGTLYKMSDPNDENKILRNTWLGPNSKAPMPRSTYYKRRKKLESFVSTYNTLIVFPLL